MKLKITVTGSNGDCVEHTVKDPQPGDLLKAIGQAIGEYRTRYSENSDFFDFTTKVETA